MSPPPGAGLSVVPDPRERTVVIVVDGPVARADIPGLCARVRCELERGDADRLVCDVSGLDEADAVTVDALARVQLTVRRLGRALELQGADVDLVALVAWMGLDRVLCRVDDDDHEPSSDLSDDREGH
jgi:ABC-type transporter Mla MlaB component